MPELYQRNVALGPLGRKALWTCRQTLKLGATYYLRLHCTSALMMEAVCFSETYTWRYKPEDQRRHIYQGRKFKSHTFKEMFSSVLSVPKHKMILDNMIL